MIFYHALTHTKQNYAFDININSKNDLNFDYVTREGKQKTEIIPNKVCYKFPKI